MSLLTCLPKNMHAKREVENRIQNIANAFGKFEKHVWRQPKI